MLVTSVIFAAKNLRKIVGGGSHVLFLINDGKVFGCGSNNKGQLGTNDQTDPEFISECAFLPFGDRVADIACGWDSSALITESGQLYTFGSNAFGQLGFSTAELKSCSRPKRLHLPDGAAAKEVSFGLQYLAVRTCEDRVYFFGRIKFAAECTAINWNNTQIWRLNVAADLRFCATGQNHFVWTSQCDDVATVHAIGDNRFGQSESISVSGHLKQVLCGWTHNAAVNEAGKVVLWGRNTYGQLGSEDKCARGPIEWRCEVAETRVKSVHLGSEHGLAITDEGDVLTWGWNEHGNCGNGSVHNM